MDTGFEVFKFHVGPMSTRKPFSLVTIPLLLALQALWSLAAVPLAWQDTNTYRAPDFEAHFPIEPEAGKRLEQFWRSIQRETSTAEQDLDLVRRGLRTCPEDTQTMVLRWFGNKYIWGKTPQNAEAVELMYHAAGTTNWGVRHYAIYFGISTVRPMTEPILRSLVDIAMRSEDADTLARIAWGGQKDRLLHHLKPHLASENPARREHAETLKKIFSGEFQAHAWAAEQARKKAQVKYSGRLEEFRGTLNKGTSKERSELVELILSERIALIMDESFIPAFAAAATDPEASVRDRVAIIAGQRWVWNASEQAPEAIELMLKLSRDPNRGVRYNANYYGLSTIRHRTDAEVERMIEMALYDGLSNGDFRGRVTWGLERSRELVRSVLRKWLAAYQADQLKAVFAYGFHASFLKEEPEIEPALQKILDGTEPVANLAGFFPVDWRPENLDEFFVALLKEVPAPYNSPDRWNTDEMPLLFLVPGDVENVQKAVEAGGRFKLRVNRPLNAGNVIALGKGVRLQEIR
jgi:hypothetical protein